MDNRDSGARFIRRMHLSPDAPDGGYPFTLPAVINLKQNGGLVIPGGATFLVGENGSGKSTLVEALAVAAGLNAEGGSQNYKFATRPSESDLARHVTLTWGSRKPRSRFFLRAESFYNVATATEELGAEQLEAFGGVSPHERSHGESFVDLMRHRFYPGGLYIMDEPEAALSPRGCMAVLALMDELVTAGSQFIIATHSPILLALPHATIYEVDEDGTVAHTAYDDALPVRLTRTFLDDPQRYLRYLLSPE